MKTSILLIAALILNTTFLLSQPMAFLVHDIPIWVFLVTELTLLLGLYIHNILKELRKAYHMDFKNLNVFVFKSPPLNDREA